MMKLFEYVLGYQRFILSEGQRAILLEKGRITDILGPGEHRTRRKHVTVEMHSIVNPRLDSTFADALLRDHAELAARHLTEVRTGPNEVAVVFRDERPQAVGKPDGRVVYWTDAGPWEVLRIDVTDTLDVDADLGERLVRAGITDRVASFEVPDGSVGLMSVNGAFERVLKPGTHRFWGIARKVTVKLVDARWQSLDVTGQEILTKDRVSLRVNLAADYRVADPVKAATEVRDYAEALHRALQFAFRKTLGALTLDQMLAEKVSVDEAAAAQVRAEMAVIGLKAGEISLKDVILPGDMRDILNQVVSAQKEAEANVIRRREETNATRSLLNTAKIMAENPVMLRLKELEALEVIAEKVGTISVHNGTQGLLTDLVKLRD